jgi:hypothetical protein
LLKFRGRLQQTWIAGALPKPVQHHRRRENRRRRVRLALTGNVGRRAVARLKHRVGVADIGRGRHSHPADQAGNLIRKNVAEHVFGDQHVEVPGPADQIQGHGVDIVMPCPDRRRERATPSNTSRKKAIETKTFALSTQVTLVPHCFIPALARRPANSNGNL